MQIVWKDRKRPVFGLPLSFTEYSMTDEKLLIKSGILNTLEKEVHLYRIAEVSLWRTLSDRIFGVGTIRCYSASGNVMQFELEKIKDARQVKETLCELVEKQRAAMNITVHEIEASL